MENSMVPPNQDNAYIQEMIDVKGCSQNLKDTMEVLHQAGIDVSPLLF